MNDVTFRPRELLGARGKLELSYDCQSPPEVRADVKAGVLGMVAVHGILSHEYLIDSAQIESASPIDATIDKCKCAKSYKVVLRYRVMHKLKLGFGLGSLTSAADWVSPAPAQTIVFDVPAVCCDPDYVPPGAKKPRPAEVTPLPAMIVAPAAFAAYGGGAGGIHGIAAHLPGWDVVKLVGVGAAITFAIFVLVISPLWIALRFYWGRILDSRDRTRQTS